MLYSISGVFSSGLLSDAPNITVVYSGAESGSVPIEANEEGSGIFSIPNLPNGTYTVTPTSINYTFAPASAIVTISNADVSGILFAPSAIYAVSGNVGLGGAFVNYSDSAGSGSVIADASGNFMTPSFPRGTTVTITPAFSRYTFAPASAVLEGTDVNLIQDFAATPPWYGAQLVQKLGLATDGTARTLAMGFYSGNNFVADPRCPNAPGFLDALAVVVPDPTTSFSIIASGESRGFGIALCLNALLPPVTPNVSSSFEFLPPSNLYRKPINTPQMLPTAIATVVSISGSFSFEADVTVSKSNGSPLWNLFLGGWRRCNSVWCFRKLAGGGGGSTPSRIFASLAKRSY